MVAYPLNISQVHVVQPFFINHIRGPKGIYTRFKIQVECAFVYKSFSVIGTCGYADIGAVTEGYVAGLGICPALGVKHPPAFFGMVIHHNRIGSPVVNRIAV
ncbi:hypothetical protein D3C73_838980 [compost metagenome]